MDIAIAIAVAIALNKYRQISLLSIPFGIFKIYTKMVSCT